MRKIDILLISIVAIYLCLVLPIFNKVHVMEFGNFSDLLSAACNIAMASAAVYAAFNANKWLAQKKYESALNHISNLLEERDKIIGVISMFSIEIRKLRGKKDKKTEFQNNAQQLIVRIFLLKKSLDACKRWDVGVPDILYDDISLLFKYCDTCLSLSEYFSPCEHQDYPKLGELRDAINEMSEFCMKRIEEIFEFPTKIPINY